MILEDLCIRYDNSWLCDISRVFPQAEINLVEFQPIDGVHWRGLLQIKNVPENFFQWLKNHKQTIMMKILNGESDAKDQYRYIAFACTGPKLLNHLVKEYNIFFQFPILLRDGEIRVKAVSSEQNLSDFYADLKKNNHYDTHMKSKTKVLDIHKADLTPRQVNILKTAIDMGYYDIPRRITLSDLALEMHISQATTAEHLRKAEFYVMKTFSA